MARARAQKDILARVTDLGSEALHKLADVPGGNRLVELANESKTRLDEMQKKLRGLDALEQRVARLEKQLAAQSKPKAPAKKPAARKPAAAKKPAARKPAS
jgi:uncharacterized membrane protein YccC